MVQRRKWRLFLNIIFVKGQWIIEWGKKVDAFFLIGMNLNYLTMIFSEVKNSGIQEINCMSKNSVMQYDKGDWWNWVNMGIYLLLKMFCWIFNDNIPSEVNQANVMENPPDWNKSEVTYFCSNDDHLCDTIIKNDKTTFEKMQIWFNVNLSVLNKKVATLTLHNAKNSTLWKLLRFFPIEIYNDFFLKIFCRC